MLGEHILSINVCSRNVLNQRVATSFEQHRTQHRARLRRFCNKCLYCVFSMKGENTAEHGALSLPASLFSVLWFFFFFFFSCDIVEGYVPRRTSPVDRRKSFERQQSRTAEHERSGLSVETLYRNPVNSFNCMNWTIVNACDLNRFSLSQTHLNTCEKVISRSSVCERNDAAYLSAECGLKLVCACVCVCVCVHVCVCVCVYVVQYHEQLDRQQLSAAAGVVLEPAGADQAATGADQAATAPPAQSNALLSQIRRRTKFVRTACRNSLHRKPLTTRITVQCALRRRRPRRRKRPRKDQNVTVFCLLCSVVAIVVAMGGVCVCVCVCVCVTVVGRNLCESRDDLVSSDAVNRLQRGEGRAN